METDPSIFQANGHALVIFEGSLHKNILLTQNTKFYP